MKRHVTLSIQDDEGRPELSLGLTVNVEGYAHIGFTAQCFYGVKYAPRREIRDVEGGRELHAWGRTVEDAVVRLLEEVTSE